MSVCEIKKKSSIVGRDKELNMIINAVYNNKHTLLEGPVGVGKTRLALAVANFMGRSIYRVDGDERYTENKLTGWFDPPAVLSKGYVWDTFIQGPLVLAMMNGGVLFINELNRMPEGTQNVLLPAMDEGKIIIPRLGEICAKPGFLIIATQNPEEFAGTSRVSEALRDRFMWIGLRYQNIEEEEEIVKRETSSKNPTLIKVAVEIMRKTRIHKDLRRGSSIRGAIDIVSVMECTDAITVQKLIDAAIMALYNRIDVQLKSNRTKEEIISEIVLSLIEEKTPEAPLKLKTCDGLKELELSAMLTQEEKKILKRDETIYKSMSNLLNGQDAVTELVEMEDAKPDPRWSIIEQYVTDVDENDKLAIESYVCRAIASLAAEISEKGMRSYRKFIDYFNTPVFHCDFDLEETVENCSGKTFIDYQDIALLNKVPRKLAVSLMFDASNSMEGEKIVMAALAVAALAYKLEKDCYSIVAFKDKAEVLKGGDEEMSIEDMVSKILHYEYGDLTNIEDGLKLGLEEINKCTSREDIADCLGILVTDGWVTAGGDPVEIAKDFKKLHVLQIGLGGMREQSLEVSIDMARVGHGTHLFIENINELPYAIMNILRLNCA